MQDLDAAISTFVFFVAASVWSLVFGGAIFSPVEEVISDSPRRGLQFGMVDLLALVGQLHFLVSIACLHGAQDQGIEFAGLIGSWGCLITFWWAGSIRMARYLEFPNLSARLLFIAVFSPVGYFLSLSLALVPVWLIGLAVTLIMAVCLQDLRAVLIMAMLLGAASLHLSLIILFRKGCQLFIADVSVSKPATLVPCRYPE
jgi:hypothetical protein